MPVEKWQIEYRRLLGVEAFGKLEKIMAVVEVMKRGMLITALYYEASFACWLSDFVKTKGTWPEKVT